MKSLFDRFYVESTTQSTLIVKPSRFGKTELPLFSDNLKF